MTRHEPNGENLKQKLATRGNHLTEQRVAVYEYLETVDHHPTTEEVFFAVKQKLPKISLATVYKNLEALADCGAITKLTYGDAAARYDIRTDHHYHTRCLACGKLSDLDAEAGDEFLAQIKPKSDFTVKDYRLELLGFCAECN